MLSKNTVNNQYAESLARFAGFRLAENLVANLGFYWRPADALNYSPAQVFPTEAEAWADCCDANLLWLPSSKQ